jgi:glycosyltransferase involved in cell wall biosynthesis
MTVVLVTLIVATLLELGLCLIRGLWNVHKYIVIPVVIGVSFGCGGLFASQPNIFTGLIALVSIYRIFNILRITEGRVKEQYLRRVTRITSLWLIGSQLLLAGAWWYDKHFDIHRLHLLVVLAILQIGVALVLAISTLWSFKKTNPLTSKKDFADRDLPDVSVVIPARNEDQQLEECLHAILASDYPKLEVLVLDDCSQDRTSQIIRNFAHDGVRFIAGKEPKANWLAKNQAYDQLAKEASGDLILFCGVDVRFAPGSIRQLVTVLKSKEKRMLSLLPLNERLSFSFAQTIRYYWELALPRRIFNRPPVISSCWLIEARLLKEAGGFTAVSNSISPESHFAQYAIKNDAYSFIRSIAHLGVVTVKSVSEQWETAIRVRYPQLHRRPEFVLTVAFAELSFLLAPYILMVVGLWDIFGIVPEVLFIIACTILAATYRSITFATSPVNRWYFAPLFPIAILADAILLNYSMGKYEFSTVEWKGRNVCIPIMQTKPRLPKIT